MEAAATNTTARRKRKYTPELLAKVAKYAVQCGSMAATRHFSEEFPLYTLGKSTSSKSSGFVEAGIVAAINEADNERQEMLPQRMTLLKIYLGTLISLAHSHLLN